MRIKAEQAFSVLDVVETDFSGPFTRHVVVERFKSRNCQSGVTYNVLPPVPKSGGKTAMLDHYWFRHVGRIDKSGGKAIFVPSESRP